MDSYPEPDSYQRRNKGFGAITNMYIYLVYGPIKRRNHKCTKKFLTL